jgi:hypothetical protein
LILPALAPACGKFDRRRAAEFAAPDDERFFEQAQPLEVG